MYFSLLYNTIMANDYLHTYNPYKVRAERVAKPKFFNEPKHHFSWVSFGRIFVTVAELIGIVGLEFISGGTASPLAIGAIGVAAASANTGIDLSQGQFSPINAAIEFGSALVPVAGGYAATAKRLSRIEANAGLLLERASLAERNLIKQEDKEFIKLLKKAKYFNNASSKKFDEVIKIMEESTERFTQETSLVRMLTQEFIQENSDLSVRARKIVQSVRRDIASRSETTAHQTILDNISEFEQLYHNIRSGAIRNATKSLDNQKVFILRMKTIAPNIKEELLQGLMGKKIKYTKNQIERELFKKELEKIYDVLSEESNEILTLLVQSAGVIDNAYWRDMYKMFTESLTAAETDRVEKIVRKSIGDTIFKSKALKAKFRGATAIRYLGSKKFNERWVQNLQLIDPNDMGRAPVEFIYRKLKGRIDKYFNKRIVAKTRKIERFFKGTYKLEKAFVKSGGKIIKRNRYLLGYKVLIKDPTGKANAVLIKFNHLYTTSKSGKNKKGKRDIMIKMSDIEIDRLQVEGKDYWFDVGEKKGWMTNRGGRRVGASLLELSPIDSLFLAFIPIPLLRNVGSIISNHVENWSSIFKGQYTGSWVSKISRSFYRSAINRTGRLFSRAVLGGAARVATADSQSNIIRMLGSGAGRELQRVTSIGLHQYEGMDAHGNFRWKAKQGRTFVTSMGKGIATSAQSGVFRGVRSRKSFGRNLHSWKTKARQVRRIPGAITPNWVLSPSKFAKFKI